MPEYQAPAVFVEEVSFRHTAITPGALPQTVFVGSTLRGPLGRLSPALKNFAAFQRVYGGTTGLQLGERRRSTNHLAHAARLFFDEGGTQLRVIRTAGGGGRAPLVRDYEAALNVLQRSRAGRLVTLAAPGAAALPQIARGVSDLLIRYARRQARQVFVLLDPPRSLDAAGVQAFARSHTADNAALYFPWLQTPLSPRGTALAVPPSGPVAGVIARVDRTRGLHHSPANEPLHSAAGLHTAVSGSHSDLLNNAGVNVIRNIPGRGIRIWGARTLSADPEWRYVSVRRYCQYLEHSIAAGLQWVVFEPNDEPLWSQVRGVTDSFLHAQWRGGALLGERPQDAYFARCDRSTMSQTDIDQRRLNLLLGVAPTRPAEFLILRIMLKTG